MTLSVSYIGWTDEAKKSVYTVVLNDVGNHYGQIVLGRVWNQTDLAGRTWWTFSPQEYDPDPGPTGLFRTRAGAAKALWEAWGTRITWNGRKP